jgi:hypothetical protein
MVTSELKPAVGLAWRALGNGALLQVALEHITTVHKRNTPARRRGGTMSRVPSVLWGRCVLTPWIFASALLASCPAFGQKYSPEPSAAEAVVRIYR